MSSPLLELKFSHFLVLLCRSIGLLKVGVPKPWDESKKNLGYIRQAGVRQFISTYNRVKDLQGDELLWGDEIEYGVFILDHEQKKARLSLRAKEVSLSVLFSIRYLYTVAENAGAVASVSWKQSLRHLTYRFVFYVSSYLDNGPTERKRGGTCSGC